MSSKINVRDIPIIFILSRGRSGSTMLQSILDAHNNICAPIESKFVLHLKTKYEHINDWSNKTINNFIKDVYSNRKFRLFWNVTPDELKNKFDQCQIHSFGDACKAVYLSHHSMFPKKEIRLIIDKNPLHSRFASQFLFIFPNAKFIHLVRDPRAVTFSHIKSLKKRHPSQLAFEWRLLNEKIEAFKKLNTAIFHTLKYEDFVENSELETARLFKFIQLDYHTDILDANITINKNYQSNSYLSLPQHENIRSPISTSKINSWNTKLNQEEIKIINLICERQLNLYSYSFFKTKKTFVNNLIIYWGGIVSNLKNNILYTLFKVPFPIRSFLYFIVSSIKDRKYKQ